jgi:dinuclear metal center YbgI/SA1388 family protein
MAISEKELVRIIETIAPRKLEEEWDSSGPQISMNKKAVERVLVAMEITKSVIEEAKGRAADYIVSHHPLIFKNIGVIDNNTITGNLIIDLIKSGISVYSAHTTFDSVFGGNNDYLAEIIGLLRVRKFRFSKNTGGQTNLGRVGELESAMSLREVCRMVKEKLDIDEEFRVVGDPDSKIHKVGVCAGAGGSLIETVVENGCSLFITGDLRYHEAQIAKESGLCLIDAGHYATERIFAENFAEKLRKAAGVDAEILTSQTDANPFAKFDFGAVRN